MDTYMYKVLERAQTFASKGWDLHGRPCQITPFTLAEAGFVCLGGDKVQCVECKGVLMNWEDDDIPMKEHKKNFPSCKFVKDWDKNALRSHPAVKIVMNTGFDLDLIYRVIQKNGRAILETASLYKACKAEKMEMEQNEQLRTAANEAERKRIRQEEIAGEDKVWKAVLEKYQRRI